MPRPGTVTLVGAGPGDPMLITLAGVEALRAADTVVYDKLVPLRLLDWAPATAKRVFVGKQAGHIYTPQPAINQLLIDLAREGRSVVRLKGGDPLIFARGAEEMEALAAAGIPFEIIPGVTAALGAAATAAIPLTHRGEASLITFVTGHDDPEKPSGVDWKGLADHPGTIVIYMARTKIGSIVGQLLEGGMPASTPIAFIQWGGSNRQKVVTSTLGESLAGPPAEIGTPMIAIVGPLVRYREELHWLEKRPLYGRTILLLRAVEQNEQVARQLENLGAEVIVEPVIRIEPPVDWKPVDQAIDQISSFDWLVFSSRNGVKFFLDRLMSRGRDARSLAHLGIATIGPATAEELAHYSLRADIVPHDFRAEALADELAKRVAGKSVLLARADRGRTVLEDQLGPLAREVRTVVTYRQTDIASPSAETLSRLKSGSITDVLLTSSNIARGFVGWLDDETKAIVKARTAIVSISPVTSEVIRPLGYEVAREATKYTMEGMIERLTAKS